MTNHTGIEGNHDEWVCPQCQKPVDIVDVRPRRCRMDGKTLFSWDVFLECMTCPQILSMMINVAVLTIPWRDEACG